MPAFLVSTVVLFWRLPLLASGMRDKGGGRTIELHPYKSLPSRNYSLLFIAWMDGEMKVNGLSFHF